MDEQPVEQPTTEPTEPTEPTPTPSDPPADTTDWQHVAELIASEWSKKQAGYETIQGTHGSVTGELRIVHEVTTGDLLVSFLLAALISTILLKWLFKAVWGR